MNRHSHIYIGQRVLLTHFPGATVSQKNAFMLGCVYPDRNPFTYLKGSIHHRMLRGHNWSNASKLIRRLCHRVEGRQELDIYTAYCLGLLLHYCCDAFTYAHNQSFRQNLKQHRSYEAHLHRQLMRGDFPEAPSSMPARDLWQEISLLHSQYRKEPCTAATDSRYIFLAVSIVCGCFSPPVCAGQNGSYILPKKYTEICPFCTCKTGKRVIY